MINPKDLVKIYEKHRLLLDLEVKGKSYHSKYNAIFKVEALPNADFPTLEDLKNYVEDLARRYPERGFTLETLELGREEPSILNKIRNFILRFLLRRIPKPRRLYIVTQKDALEKKDAITLAFDLDRKTVFIHRKDLEKERKLVNYLIFRSLGSLNLVQSRYERIVRGVDG